ncbi:TPA: YadA-like family protein [Escherichia coli]
MKQNVIAALVLSALTAPAFATPVSDAQQAVDKAQATFDKATGAEKDYAGRKLQQALDRLQNLSTEAAVRDAAHRVAIIPAPALAPVAAPAAPIATPTKAPVATPAAVPTLVAPTVVTQATPFKSPNAPAAHLVPQIPTAVAQATPTKVPTFVKPEYLAPKTPVSADVAPLTKAAYVAPTSKTPNAPAIPGAPKLPNAEIVVTAPDLSSRTAAATFEQTGTLTTSQTVVTKDVNAGTPSLTLPNQSAPTSKAPNAPVINAPAPLTTAAYVAPTSKAPNAPVVNAPAPLTKVASATPAPLTKSAYVAPAAPSHLIEQATPAKASDVIAPATLTKSAYVAPTAKAPNAPVISAPAAPSHLIAQATPLPLSVATAEPTSKAPNAPAIPTNVKAPHFETVVTAPNLSSSIPAAVDGPTQTADVHITHIDKEPQHSLTPAAPVVNPGPLVKQETPAYKIPALPEARAPRAYAVPAEPAQEEVLMTSDVIHPEGNEIGLQEEKVDVTAAAAGGLKNSNLVSPGQANPSIDDIKSDLNKLNQDKLDKADFTAALQSTTTAIGQSVQNIGTAAGQAQTTANTALNTANSVQQTVQQGNFATQPDLDKEIQDRKDADAVTLTQAGAAAKTAIDAAVNPLAQHVNDVEADVTTNTSDISTLKTDVGTNKTDITTLKGQVGGIATNTAAIATKADQADLAKETAARHQDINTLDQHMKDKVDLTAFNVDKQRQDDALKAETTRADGVEKGLDTRVTTNATDIGTNKNDISINKADIASNQSHIVSVESQAISANNLANQNNHILFAHDQRISDVDSKASTNTVAISDETTRATTEEKRLDSVKAEKSDVVTLQTQVSQKVDKSTYQQRVAVVDQQIKTANDERKATNQKVAKNTADIADHEKRITNLEANSSANFGKLKNQVEQNRKRASAGIAGVAAMANIPPVNQGQTFAVGAGVGNTDGESALAVGFSARASESVTVKASVSNDTQHNFVVGAGVSYGW